MLNNINKNNITVNQPSTSAVLYSATNYWKLLPIEIFEKIICYLDMTDIMKAREISSRYASIIDSSAYINKLKLYYKAKKNFATVKEHTNIEIATKNSFIEYLEKNYCFSHQELTDFKKSIAKFKYVAIQFIFAKIMANANYELKKIYTLKRETLYDNLCMNALMLSNFIITDESNKCLYIKDHELIELIINKDEFTKTQTIFYNTVDTYIPARIFLQEIYKNYIILGNTTFKNNIIFLKKINTNYFNITPPELHDVDSIFIEIQSDKQGNTVFVVQEANDLKFYNTNDNHNSNSYDYNLMISQIINVHRLKITRVLSSKHNNLMLVYGENEMSNNLELHIYKYNEKIDSIIFEAQSSRVFHQLACSPQGDGFAIVSEYNYTSTEYSLYKIKNNKPQKIYTKLDTKLDSYDSNRILIYGNGGKTIILNEGLNNILYICDNNNIKSFNVNLNKKYSFNSSGYLLLTLQNDDKIQIYNFQRGIKQQISILCIDQPQIAKFSPNSQLVAVVEKHNRISILRIYKIMTVEPNGSIIMLPKAKQVTQYCTDMMIMDFKFHPDGTKLIIAEYSKMFTLEITKMNVQ